MNIIVVQSIDLSYGMHLLRKSQLKTIVVWVIINSAFGAIVTLMTYNSALEPFLRSLARIEINFHVISSLSAATGYFLMGKIRCSRKFLKNGLVVAGTLCATAIASYINLFIVNAVFAPLLTVNVYFAMHVLLPALVISLLLTVTVLFIEDLTGKNKKHEKETGGLVFRHGEKPKADGILVRYENCQKYIRYSDIAYISSIKRLAIVHTVCGDYKLSRHIGDVEKDVLHYAFMRIHKQFIVNSSYISHLKYNQGGCYYLYLNDEDDTMLPVGRKYAAELRNYMKR
jgi:hypothetical protein